MLTIVKHSPPLALPRAPSALVLTIVEPPYQDHPDAHGFPSPSLLPPTPIPYALFAFHLFFLAKLTLLEGSIGYGPIVKAFTLPLSQVIPVPGCSQHLRSLSLSGNVNPLQRAETYPRFLS